MQLLIGLDKQRSALERFTVLRSVSAAVLELFLLQQKSSISGHIMSKMSLTQY